MSADRGRAEAGPAGRPEPDEIGPCSSPPCFLHELDPAYLGLPAGSEAIAAPARPLDAEADSPGPRSAR